VTHASRAFGALAGAAALIIAGMSPASAAIWRHNDAVGDVLSQTETFDEETGDFYEPELTAVPENTDTDVSRIRVAHRTHRVALKTTLRDLSATSGYVAYNVRTGARNYFVMQRLGKDRLYPAFDLSRMNGKPVRCAGVKRSVDRVNDRATVSIPTRCLGRPDWVRVGAAAVKVDLSDETAFTFLVDDAMQEATALDELAMSPRVHRN
jgi:hypothetical protein